MSQSAMRAIRYRVIEEATGLRPITQSQSAMRAIRYRESISAKSGSFGIKSQSAMRAIRYRASTRSRLTTCRIRVAIRYACNKI